MKPLGDDCYCFLSCPSTDAPLKRPLGDLLDELFKESVAQIGDGLTLGMSSHMMKFFSMPGPFVGVCMWGVVVVWSRGRVEK